MDATQTARRITRKHAYRGQAVTVTWKDGTTTTGTLLAWGGQRISVHADGQYVEHSVIAIAQVTEAR